MLNKINIKKIIIDHFATLIDADKGKAGISDILLFLILPLGSSAFVVFYLKIFLSDSLINILITSLSIFVGLLLNLLIIIFDVINKIKIDTKKGEEEELIKKNKIKRHFLKEIYSNISFCILISIVTIGFLVLSMLHYEWVKLCSNLITYAILCLFGLTLLMILKRVHILLSNEFKDCSGQ